MKYIYGPVSSWRLGSSLGIDLISGEKVCSFDCVYCQLRRKSPASLERKLFVLTEEIIKEFELLPKNLQIDYITFSGSGEPTLALNLSEVVTEIKKRSVYKTAILTNSTLMNNPRVRKELSLFDLAAAKLDAASEKTFKEINQPVSNLTLNDIITGIKVFRKEFPEKLAIQAMFTEKNKNEARSIAQLVKEISPIKVFIGTPIRPCPEKSLSKQEIDEIESFFKPLETVNVFSAKRIEIQPMNVQDTFKRRSSEVLRSFSEVGRRRKETRK